MAVATWHGKVVAESDDVAIVDGYPYFPRESLRTELCEPSDTTTQCGWKGTAHYYSLRVGPELNRDAAWYYPDPKPAAAMVAGRVGFWRGVIVTGARKVRAPRAVDAPGQPSCDVGTRPLGPDAALRSHE